MSGSSRTGPLLSCNNEKESIETPQREVPNVTNKELTEIVKSLANSVVHHDDQIEAHSRQIDGLIRVTTELRVSTVELRQTVEKQSVEIANLIREWQGYLRTVRPQ